MPHKFYDLGPRGIVVYEQPTKAAGTYTYELESDWRARAIASPSKALTELAAGKFPVAALPDGRVFVNFDAMPGLPEGHGAPGTSSGNGGSEADYVIIHEKQKFFSVARPPQGEKSIPDGFEMDAGVLVRRGALIGAIPGGDLPVGTWCVLLNFAQLVR